VLKLLLFAILSDYCSVKEFYKYHGAGNDFILIDDREQKFLETDHQLIQKMCDRHFGIGADGLMLLRNHDEFDFEMIYYNSDGRQSSMCGNGGRCIVSFAHSLGVIRDSCSFLAIDGVHQAKVHDATLISLEMIDVKSIEDYAENTCVLDTGSPHFVQLRKSIDQLDLIFEARKIRYNDRFSEQGININFVEWKDNKLHIRTYERGVENETLACGTGVTAAAIAMHHWNRSAKAFQIEAKGGSLEVAFDVSDNHYSNVWKKGPVRKVFEGRWENQC
jgi:diaminopimelate epimerase